MIPRTTTSKHYPYFIRENKTLQKFSKQEKVFPRIGLNNCEKNIGDGRKIVFSGSGNKALWDIATMSTGRGISSCQNWNNEHSKSLIGSMIDPYCGIIYITDGNKLRKGTHMLARAIVRFVVNRKTHEPSLLIERIYPYELNFNRSYIGDYYSTNRYSDTFKLFSNFLKEKTKLPIVIGGSRNFIPLTNAVARLSAGQKSYRDSGISYSKFEKFSRVSKVKKVK